MITTEPNVITGHDQIARARTADPATSHQAAQSVSALRPKQNAVLAVFNRSEGQGFSDEEMIARYYYLNSISRSDFPSQSESGLRTRRSELVALGYLIATTERRQTKNSRDSIVWRAV